jgi:GH15 family glucan-1,4-alpha-glucosidase
VGIDDHPSIGEYGLIGDCRTAALVSRAGSIDWCCLPRFDAGSAFARLLDSERGGHCSITPRTDDPRAAQRQYRGNSLVLDTSFEGPRGQARLTDCFTMPADRAERRQLLRIVEGVQGTVEFDLQVAPRFDYGEIRPWIRRHDDTLHSAIGGDDALVVWFERGAVQDGDHELTARFTVSAGERVHLSLVYCRPEHVGERPPSPDPASLDGDLEWTLRWWEAWSETISADDSELPGVGRSALILKALTYVPTGAIVAAPTTSLPEVPKGERNWDYRYAWVRDSSFSSRAFAEIGCETEADAFRAFVMRSAAGHADDLQVLYGVGGERRIGIQEPVRLAGYRGASPVRIGNAASGQEQFDAFGELVNLTWRWHRRGHSPDDDDWRFLVSLIDRAAELWPEPDCGIWEWPSEPDHFVHSKVLCWSALDRGIRLASECMRRAPTRRWRQARDELREAIESRGYDADRGVFVQAFDRPDLDAALLLLPSVEFVEWTDERMLRTVAAIREELDAGDGLLYRYRRADGLPGEEGAFVACSFWLAEALARGGDRDEAHAVFDRALATAGDLGLFSEEVDPKTGELLGNYPQGLTHLSHISAAVALAAGS